MSLQASCPRCDAKPGGSNPKRFQVSASKDALDGEQNIWFSYEVAVAPGCVRSIGFNTIARSRKTILWL